MELIPGSPFGKLGACYAGLYCMFDLEATVVYLQGYSQMSYDTMGSDRFVSVADDFISRGYFPDSFVMSSTHVTSHIYV